MAIISAPRRETPAPLWKRIVWLLAIWAAGVAALGLVSLVLRLWLKTR
jgi:hypothetical protein